MRDLKQKKFIERRAGSANRRVKSLHLTAVGNALLQKVMTAVDRAQDRMVAPLKVAERKTLMALLVRLVDLNNDVSRVPLRAKDAI